MTKKKTTLSQSFPKTGSKQTPEIHNHPSLFSVTSLFLHLYGIFSIAVFCLFLAYLFFGHLKYFHRQFFAMGTFLSICFPFLGLATYNFSSSIDCMGTLLSSQKHK